MDLTVDLAWGIMSVGSVSSDGRVMTRKGSPVGSVNASGTVTDNKGAVVGTVRGSQAGAVRAGGAVLLLAILKLK
jgi:hypothetical protein